MCNNLFVYVQYIIFFVKCTLNVSQKIWYIAYIYIYIYIYIYVYIMFTYLQYIDILLSKFLLFIALQN